MLRYYLLSFFMYCTTGAVSPYVQIFLRNMGFSQTRVGFFLAFGEIAGTVVPLVIGATVDKHGRVKRTLFVSILCVVIPFVCMMFKLPVLPLALLFATSYGFYKSIDPVMDSYCTSEFKGDPRIYSNVRAFGTLGYVVMLSLVALTGFPTKDSNRQILCSIVLFYAIYAFFVAIAPKPEAVEKQQDREKFSFKWFDKSFYAIIFIEIFSKIAMGLIDIMLGSYMTEVLHLNNSFTLFVAFGALCEFVAFLVYGAKLKNGKITIWGLLMLSFIGMFVRFTIYYTTSSIIMFLIAQSLHSLSFGCNHIAVTSFISKTVPSEHRNLAMSIYFSIAINFSNMLGVLFGGMLIDRIGYNGVFMIYSVLPLISLTLCIYFKNLINSRLV